ncbi:hypothetical protein [Pseudarthrobacter sp. MDT3-1]
MSAHNDSYCYLHGRETGVVRGRESGVVRGWETARGAWVGDGAWRVARGKWGGLDRLAVRGADARGSTRAAGGRMVEWQ